MKSEIRKYISLLETRFPDAPENAFFAMKSEHHDFGPYYEAVVKYDENDENDIIRGIIREQQQGKETLCVYKIESENKNINLIHVTKFNI